MIYLASPYSSPLPRVQNHRFHETARFVAHHFRLDVPLVSPIVYCHTIASRYQLPGHDKFWQFLNHELLSRSSAMWVLMLPGWDVSIGVRAEIEMAQAMNLPIEYKEPFPDEDI